MTFRLSPEMAAQLRADIAEGVTSETHLKRVIEMTPIGLCKITTPGMVKASFEKEIDLGQTFGEVFGKFATEQILEKCVNKIRAGAYRLTPALATEIDIEPLGTFAMGDWAAFLFIFECLESRDKETHNWACDAARQVGPMLNTTWEEVSKFTLDDIKKKLKSLEVVEAEPEQPQVKSFGAHGQTRKPGSHRDSRRHK